MEQLLGDWVFLYNELEDANFNILGSIVAAL